ncbi:hypothetical protein LQZ19_15925 [Treponema primitia]|uniref:hypothetical protein n=1 Tax=Treponema primitia TaxID=88058 RepID=UPI0039818096
MAQFVVRTLSKSNVEELVNHFSWDYDFTLDKDEYLCLTDGATFIILTIDEQVCINITLIKYDKRLLNYFDLAANILELPFKMYFFNSERRLGNKYQFITRLLGGTFFEDNNKYYYKIDASVARQRIVERLFFIRTREYKSLCAPLEGFVKTGFENILVYFQEKVIKFNNAGIIINVMIIENEYNIYYDAINKYLYNSLLKNLNFNKYYLDIIFDKNKLNIRNTIDYFIEDIIRRDIEFVNETINKFADGVIFIIKDACFSKLNFIETEIMTVNEEVENLKSKEILNYLLIQSEELHSVIDSLNEFILLNSDNFVWKTTKDATYDKY